MVCSFKLAITSSFSLPDSSNSSWLLVVCCCCGRVWAVEGCPGFTSSLTEEQDDWEAFSGGFSRGSEMGRASYHYSGAIGEFLIDCFAPMSLVGADCRFEEEVWCG